MGVKLYKRIKQRPEDFVVREIPLRIPQEKGRFYLVKLTKSNVSTLEALRVLSRLLRIPLKSIGFAGLKDKFAVTEQFLTIPTDFSLERACFSVRWNHWIPVDSVLLGKEMGFCIEPVGFTDKPLELGDLKGNLFTIVVRNFEKNMREGFYARLEVVKRYGFPNYFGEQRFGSVKSRDDFVLRYILKGDYDGALRSYFFGKSSVYYWGDWKKLYKTLSPALEEYEKDLIRGLMRGLPPEKAFRILPKNVRLMFNFAFQSFLWNEYLRNYIERKYPYVRIPFVNNWKLSYYLNVEDINYLRDLEIPYTGHRYQPEDRILRDAIRKVQKIYGVKGEWFDREVGGMVVMTDGLRKAVVYPSDFRVLEKTKRTIKLQFSLPSGSYATVLLRFLLKG